MAITAKYILLCDDCRREDNGKFLILGLYTPDMAVPMIPFPMPTICFFMNLESDRPGTYPFSFKLEQSESGTMVAQGMGAIPVNDPSVPIIVPIKFGGFQIATLGVYTFSVQFEGQRYEIRRSKRDQQFSE